MKIFPNLSPFQYASNRPIDGIDLDGLEWFNFGISIRGKKLLLKKVVSLEIVNNSNHITDKEAYNIATKIAEISSKSLTGKIDELFDMEVTVYNKMVEKEDVDYNSFYLEFNDKIVPSTDPSPEDAVGHHEGNSLHCRMQVTVIDPNTKKRREDELIVRSGVHELAHTGGLEHWDTYNPVDDWKIAGEVKNDQNNIMQSLGNTGTNALPIQRSYIEKNLRRDMNNEFRKSDNMEEPQ